MLTSLLLAVQTHNHLQIDPLLVRQAAEVWSIIAREDNPVWPGWNATKTPILIYLPGKQDLLINHPKPPDGFIPYTGPVRFPGATMHIKNGPTLIDFDGQNTARDVNGIQTLVVADTISNRRQQLLGQTTSEAIENALMPRALDSMLMFAHEAFHVHQFANSKKGGNELALLTYPSLSPENNAGFALEAILLARALRSADPRPDAVRWLAIRESRRKALKPAHAEYEDGTEFNEGLAKYIEWKALEPLAKRKPHPEMWLIQGFTGYSDLKGNQDRLLDQMSGFMTGKTNVNNDPFGASPVRMRLYYSGMGAAALLDRLGRDWKTKIFGEATMTRLLKEALRATEPELESAWSEVSKSEEYRAILQQKQDLAKRGETHISEVLAGFDSAAHSFVIDYSQLQKPRVGYGFTPFGILRIDDNRRVFRLIPLRGLVGSLTFAEDSARPVLDDSGTKRITFILTGEPKELPEGKVTGVKVDLPGLSLTNVTGTFRKEGGRITLILSD